MDEAIWILDEYGYPEELVFTDWDDDAEFTVYFDDDEYIVAVEDEYGEVEWLTEDELED